MSWVGFRVDKVGFSGVVWKNMCKIILILILVESRSRVLILEGGW